MKIFLIVLTITFLTSCIGLPPKPLDKKYNEKTFNKDIEAIFLDDESSGLILRDNVNILQGHLDNKTYKEILRAVMDTMALKRFRENNS